MRWLVSVVFWLTIAALVAIAVLAVAGTIDAVTAGVATGIVLLAAAASAPKPSGLAALARRIESISVGKFTLKFAEQAIEDAQAAVRESGTDPDEDSSDPKATDVIDIRLKLQKKLTYIAKHMLPRLPRAPDEPDCCYITIGSLLNYKFLTEAQARTLDRVSTMPSELLTVIPEPEQNTFLNEAEKVVRNLRATVFRIMVRKLLGSDKGISTTELQTKTRRPVHIVSTAGGTVCVVPVFAVRGSGVNLSKVASRPEVRELTDTASLVLYVVPDKSNALDVALEGPAEVIEFSTLLDRLRQLVPSS